MRIMMKVLHVIPKMDPKMGGVCQAVRTMIGALREENIYSEVVSLDAPDAAFLSQDSFIIHALGNKKGAWIYSPELVPWLTKNVLRFTTVIVHGMWNYHTYAVRKAMNAIKNISKQEVQPPVYVMPHGMLDPYFQRASGRKLKAIRNWIYWKLIERHVVNKADGLLFTCSEELRLAAEPFHPYKPKRQIITGLGVDDPPSFRIEMKKAFLAKCSKCSERPYILFLGRIDEKKGVDMLVGAYETVFKNRKVRKSVSVMDKTTAIPESQVPALVISGPGLDTYYGRKIQQQVVNAKMQDNIFFPGMLTGDAKWGAFYNCVAFILPSHQENFGIAVVEALAAKKPVLITNRVNIWNEINIAKAGLIDDDTMEGTTNLLEGWLELQSEEKLAMGNRARKLYEEYFAVKNVSTRMAAALYIK